MNYWDRIEIIFLILTATQIITSVALTIIAMQSIKRNQLLGKKKSLQ